MTKVFDARDIDALIHDKGARVHFVGIGGTGMSAYADFRAFSSAAASGSDRGFDAGRNLAQRDAFLSRGISIFPQDGSGVSGARAVVVSAAIEKTVPDYAAALAQNIPVITRADWLSAHYRAYPAIAITGTSGKSTVTAMAFEILRALRVDPSLISGADLKSLLSTGKPGNAAFGTGPLVIEADESDKGIAGYAAEIGVILNLQRDHDEPENMLPALAAFQKNCRRACILSDDPALTPLRDGAVIFGETATDLNFRISKITLGAEGSDFYFGDVPVHINLPGRHNVDNAAAALSVARVMGLSVADAAQALGTYQGVARRFDIIADKNGITVIDDYAHNPVKIAAAISAAQMRGQRLIICYQPHGFGPTRFMRPDLVAMFEKTLRPQDQLCIAPIYYAGGTAAQDIASTDLVSDLARSGRSATALEDRSEFIAQVEGTAQAGDVVLIVGGRDPLLPAFARDVATALQTK